MPTWFVAFELLAGAFFVIHGVASLVRGRSLVPRVFGRKAPSPWEFVTQILLGLVFWLLAASMWPDSPIRMPAAVAAVLVSILGVVTGLGALLHSARGPQRDRPAAG